MQKWWKKLFKKKLKKQHPLEGIKKLHKETIEQNNFIRQIFFAFTQRKKKLHFLK